MVNIMQSLYTAQDAMRINQAGMSVVSNNIANMNTEGYSKQRLDSESVAFNAGSVNAMAQIQSGTVGIAKVTRYQDEFLNSFIVQENSTLGYDSKSTEVLNALDGYFNEINGSGITGSLKDYFTATQQLALDPTSKVARANFISQATSVASEFNVKYNQLADYRTSLVGDATTSNILNNSQIGKLTQEINNKLEQITELNDKIAVSATQNGVQPNSLLDKRQVLLESLSKQIPVTVRVEGSFVNLYIGNVQLVENGKQLAQLKATVGDSDNPVIISVVDKATGNDVVADYKVNFPQDQGELKALLDAGGNGPDSILDFIKQLNTVAQNFAVSVNNIQLKQLPALPAAATEASLKIDIATNKLTPATENIFLNDPNSALYNPLSITAANIVVNKAVKDNPFEVATAYGPVAAGVATNPDALGNNNNALAFQQMRDTPIVALGNLTAENYYYSTIASVGNNASLSKSKLDAQQASVQQLLDKKQSSVGVNLDEELVDLMKYQKAYQASAQVFNAVNQMMSVIMNMGK